MAITILYREELKEYNFGLGHPFQGDRYQIFPDFLKENLLEGDNYRILKAEYASDEDLLLICKEDYLNFIKTYYQNAQACISLARNYNIYNYISQDNIPMTNPGKLEQAARLLIGQAKMAIDLIHAGKANKIVSIGGGMHHASENYGEGFCIYNDVAFGAEYSMEKYGLERILILDTDAHAGNGLQLGRTASGTCGYFYKDPRVLFIDVHQDPKTLYPGRGFIEEIGEGKGRGWTVNCPLSPNTGWDSYQYIFDQIIFPMTEEFRPQLIIRNGGSDPYWNDPLTELGLRISDFRKIGENLREMVKIIDGKEIDLIGSGYNPKAVGPGWLSLICGLANIEISIEEAEPVPDRYREDLSYKDTKDMVKELKRGLKNYWGCLKK